MVDDQIMGTAVEVDALRTFLLRHENFSLFLLSNLEAHGPRLGEAANSANYRAILQDGEVRCVFALTRRGILLVTSELEEVHPLILQACRAETVPLRGMLTEWSFGERCWDYLQQELGLSCSYRQRQRLYTLSGEGTGECIEGVRRLGPADFPLWRPLNEGYGREMGEPTTLTQQQAREQFVGRAARQEVWGLFREGQLVAVAELNARAGDLGQVGGVYTQEAYRGRGYCRQVMRQLISDSRELHRLRKLIIFTAENNRPARAVYEGCGAELVGHYGIFFA